MSSSQKKAQKRPRKNWYDCYDLHKGIKVPYKPHFTEMLFFDSANKGSRHESTNTSSGQNALRDEDCLPASRNSLLSGD